MRKSHAVECALRTLRLTVKGYADFPTYSRCSEKCVSLLHTEMPTLKTPPWGRVCRNPDETTLLVSCGHVACPGRVQKAIFDNQYCRAKDCTVWFRDILAIRSIRIDLCIREPESRLRILVPEQNWPAMTLQWQKIQGMLSNDRKCPGLNTKMIDELWGTDDHPNVGYSCHVSRADSREYNTHSQMYMRLSDHGRRKVVKAFSAVNNNDFERQLGSVKRATRETTPHAVVGKDKSATSPGSLISP